MFCGLKLYISAQLVHWVSHSVKITSDVEIKNVIFRISLLQKMSLVLFNRQKSEESIPYLKLILAYSTLNYFDSRFRKWQCLVSLPTKRKLSEVANLTPHSVYHLLLIFLHMVTYFKSWTIAIKMHNLSFLAQAICMKAKTRPILSLFFYMSGVQVIQNFLSILKLFLYIEKYAKNYNYNWSQNSDLNCLRSTGKHANHLGIFQSSERSISSIFVYWRAPNSFFATMKSWTSHFFKSQHHLQFRRYATPNGPVELKCIT